MALVPRQIEIELATGREGRRDAYHVAAAQLLELENGTFRGGIIVRRAGTRRLTDGILGGGTLATALAVAACGGETLRWTTDGIWGLTENQASNGWVRRGTANDARPLELAVQDVVSRATSADAHDAVRLGNLDVIAWTEAEEPSNAPARRVLQAVVLDKDTGIIIAGPTRLAEDTGGTEFWRFQPRLLTVGARAFLLYAYGERLVGRVLDSATPQTWGAEVELAADVAERFTTRYPFEFDAVVTSSSTIRIVYTANEAGGRVVEAINNPDANPAPTVDVAPNTTFSGTIDFVVTADTELSLARTAVTDPLAKDPTTARPSFAFTGTVAGKIIEDSSIVFAVAVPPDVPGRYPAMNRTTYRFDGVVRAGLYKPALTVLTVPAAPPTGTLALTTAGLINTYGVEGATLTVEMVSHEFDIGLGQWVTEFAATAPGFADGWIVIGAGGAHYMAAIGYTYTAANLAGAFALPKVWTYTIRPLTAVVLLDGGSESTGPAASPYYMYDGLGPRDIELYDGLEVLGLRVTFAAGQGPNYTTTERYEWTVQSGKVAYSVNAGPYGTPQRIYSGTTGLPLEHEPVAGLIWTWDDAIPNRYTVDDIWTLTVPAGLFTYELNGGGPSTALPILGPDGQPVTTALTVLPYPGALLGIDLTWPADVDFPVGEAWQATITSVAKLNMLTADFVGAITGPTSASTTSAPLPPVIDIIDAILDGGALTVTLTTDAGGGAWEFDYTTLPSGTASAEAGTTPGTAALLENSSAQPNGMTLYFESGEPYTVADEWTWDVEADGLRVIGGPTLLGTTVIEGLHLAAQGNNRVLVTFRNRTEGNLEARVYDIGHALVVGPIILATAAQSQAAQGLYHTATRLLGPTSWEALFEPLSQNAVERITFNTAGPGSVTAGPTPYARGLRLLTRHFLLDGRTMLGAVYLPRYGGLDADEAGVQPVALILEADTQEVLARVLPGEAAPLTSLSLPQVLTEAGKATVVLPRRGRLTLEQGATVADITPALLTRVTLDEVAPAEMGRLEENATLHVGGGLPLYYDGQVVTEDGFHVGPEGLQVTMAGSGGQLSAGSYVWHAVYERTDARGRRHQSPPSPPVQATAVDDDLAVLSVPLYQATRMPGVRIVVYRTEANGTIAYRLTPGVGTFLQPPPEEVTADTVAIADGAADEDLLDNEPLYTARGELPHLAPPAYRSIHRWTDYLWIDRMEAPQDFLYSLPLRAAEGTAWAAELAGAIASEHGPLVGTHDIGGALVLFAEKGAYIVQGNGPDVTGGGNTLSEPTKLEGAVGLEDHRAKVTAPDGIFFWARGRPHVLTRGLQTVEPGGGGAGFSALTITGAMVAVGTPPLEAAGSKDSSDEVRFFSAEGTVLVYSYAWNGWGTWTGQPALALGQEALALRADGARLVREAPDTTYDEVPATGTGGTPVVLRWSHSWIKLADFLGAERARWFHLAAYFGEDADVLAELYRNLDPTPTLTHTWAVAAGQSLDMLRWHPGPDHQRCTAFRVRWTVTPTTPAATPSNQAFKLHALGVELGVKPGKDHRAGRRS